MRMIEGLEEAEGRDRHHQHCHWPRTITTVVVGACGTYVAVERTKRFRGAQVWVGKAELLGERMKRTVAFF